MIITKLQGGLGNQLFQYAAGRSLALRHNQELYLDLGDYGKIQDGLTIRQYRLNDFPILAKIASEEQILKLTSTGTLIEKIFNKIAPRYLKRAYTHLDFNFDSNFFKLKKNTYIYGYWQSYLYFNKYEKVIQQELTLNSELSIENQEIFNKLKNTESVSIHVRRGDYITNKEAAKLLGSLNTEYYDLAVSFIHENIKNPHFFIFSDDPEWVRLNMLIDRSVIVDTKSELLDLFFMSNCHHNIIANSSFSWWGAWLNQHTNKIVIAPKNWFRDAKINTDDLIPKEWQRL
jgi:hypothetical protein